MTTKTHKLKIDLVQIYGLHDPVTGELRYIGKANNSVNRLKSHLRDSKKRNTPVYCWIRKLAKDGLIPVCKVILETDDWVASERELIHVSRAMGDRLLNIADGGDEPYCSKETRQRNGAKNARFVHDNPVRHRIWEIKKTMMSAIKRGEVNEKTREKLKQAAKKRPEIFGCFATI